MKKNLRFLMLTLLCAVFSTAWGDTAKLTNANIVAAGQGDTGYKSWTITDGSNRTWNAYAIKNQHSKDTSDKHFLQIKKYGSNTAYYIQLPEFDGIIKSITMTVSSTSKPMNGGSNTVNLYFSSSNSTSAQGEGVAVGSGESSVTIDCSSLNLSTGYITASGGVRIWDVEVEYENTKIPVVTFGDRLNPGTNLPLAYFGSFRIDGQTPDEEGVIPAEGITERDYTLIWESSDQEILEVSEDGQFSCLKEGTVTLTVTATTTKEGYKDVSKEFTITITGVDPELKFTPSYLTLNVGETGTSIFSKKTTADATFSNDNPDVATYDPETGVVTAIAEGEAIITATAPQDFGQPYNPGTAKLTIVVQDMNKKGGLNNPYTVDELKGLTDGNYVSGNIYVKGYIAGAYVNNNFEYDTSGINVSAYTNTNLAFADEAGETDESNVIPVELPSGILRNLGAKIEGNMGIQVLLKGNNLKYFGKSGIKKTSEAYIITNIGSAGYSTVYYGNIALVVPEGTVATTVKLGDDGKLVYTPVADNIIPAGTGVVLQGSGEQKLKVVSTDNTAPTNDLYGTDISTNQLTGSSDSYYYYKLSLANNSTDPATVGFYWGAEDGGMFTNGAHKAYMALPKSSASSYVFDETVDISAIKETFKSADGIYTLSGMKVSGDYLPKGIYIVNGKKMVIK